ncbi:hypothetical protein CFBP4996_27135 (plasmid) [Agrobacterium leguminum]|nr:MULTISPECIES: hypothetical protein [Agrobacterium]WFS69938.1 hypothetical protein CFBP4996_27135 [Agrobacterium leguminum]
MALFKATIEILVDVDHGAEACDCIARLYANCSPKPVYDVVRR